ncbi:MAG: hypothetical protein ACLRX2_12220 [Oscillospiraceae bacterium]
MGTELRSLQKGNDSDVKKPNVMLDFLIPTAILVATAIGRTSPSAAA